MEHIRFRLLHLSQNTNSFGHHGAIIVSETGKAFELHVSMLSVQRLREDPFVTLPVDCGMVEPTPELSFEVPRALADMPAGMAREHWDSPVPAPPVKKGPKLYKLVKDLTGLECRNYPDSGGDHMLPAGSLIEMHCPSGTDAFGFFLCDEAGKHPGIEISLKNGTTQRGYLFSAKNTDINAAIGEELLPAKQRDIVAEIMAYEDGEMPEEDIPAFISEVVEKMPGLQGGYGRAHVQLEEAGLI